VFTKAWSYHRKCTGTLSCWKISCARIWMDTCTRNIDNCFFRKSA